MIILLTAFVLWKFDAPPCWWDWFIVIIAARVFFFGVGVICGFIGSSGGTKS